MILSAYLLGEYAKRIVMSLFVMSLLYIVIDLFEKLDEFIVNKATTEQLIMYFVYKLPLLIIQMTPVAILISTMFLIGAFSKSNEFTAMKAAGIPLIRIVSPLLTFAFLISLLILLLNETLVPVATARSNHILQNEIRKVVVHAVYDSDIWVKGKGNLFWNVQSYDPKKKEMHNVRVLKLDKEYTVEYRVDAKRATWNGTAWVLFGGEFWDFKNPLKFHAKTVDGEAVKILTTPPRSFRVVQRPSEELNAFELSRYIDDVKAEGYDASRYEVELYSKFSFPFLSFIMAMVAIPFAMRRGRSGGGFIGIGFSIIIGFSFWVVMSLGVSLGRGALLPPLLAAWFGNILYFCGGFYLLLTSKQ